MRQASFASVGFERFGKTTRRAAFLSEMDQVVPWQSLCQLIEPVYPKPGNGRPPIGLERMLRIYFLQQWFDLSDPAVEEALYESTSMRQFAGIDLGREPAPDETTVCKFRHLLERHDLGRALFEQVHVQLKARGVRMSKGTTSTPPSSPHRPRPRTRRSSATRTCTRPARASNGISA
jgi:IS5 family transposase